MDSWFQVLLEKYEPELEGVEWSVTYALLGTTMHKSNQSKKIVTRGVAMNLFWEGINFDLQSVRSHNNIMLTCDNSGNVNILNTMYH